MKFVYPLAVVLVLTSTYSVRADDPPAACATVRERAVTEVIATLTELGHPRPASVRDSYLRQLDMGFTGCATLSAEHLTCLNAAPSVGLGISTYRVNVGRAFPERLRLPTLTAIAHAPRLPLRCVQTNPTSMKRVAPR